MPCLDTTPHEATHDTPFGLGWDHARYGLTPPLERLCINPRLRDGFRAGRTAFGRRTLEPKPAVRAWLQLRLAALAAGRAFETVRLTPSYLRRLSITHCPITREPLAGTDSPDGAHTSRVRNDAAYAAGNLAQLGARAGAAKDTLGNAAALALLKGGAAEPDAWRGGLTRAQWRRLAALTSYALPLTHDAAAALPLLLLPPSGVLLFNPAQALRACASRAWLDAAPNRRLASLREALPGGEGRVAFDAFVSACHAAVVGVARERPAASLRWAIEDAWADARVCRRWKRFALTLTPAQCEALVLHHEPNSALQRPDSLATEGWALDSGGRATLPRRAPLRLALPGAARRAEPVAAQAQVARAPLGSATASRLPQRALFTH